MCNEINCSHDFDDAIDDIFGGLDTAPRHVLANAEVARATRAATTYTETCPSCRGTGQFRSYSGRVVGDCFKCKGAGELKFKTSSEQRAKSQASAAASRDRKAATAAEQAQAWLDANPVEAEWLRQPVTGDFTFHADMLAALVKYGSLTERQEASVRNAAAKSVARKAQWAAEKADREAGAAVLTLTKIRAGFDSAVRHLKRPKLRIADIQFSLAPATGRNVGCIYVVRASDDTYLGKITQDDKFITSRDCTAADSETVARVAADPAAAATAHGHEFGNCSCCGRELTNPESVARGIGPICAERWGW
jgi:TorA maturation chaperone TorD